MLTHQVYYHIGFYHIKDSANTAMENIIGSLYLNISVATYDQGVHHMALYPPQSLHQLVGP